MKIPEIEPTTSLLVARCYNQLYNRDFCPEMYVFYLLKTESGLVACLRIISLFTGAFFLFVLKQNC